MMSILTALLAVATVSASAYSVATDVHHRGIQSIGTNTDYPELHRFQLQINASTPLDPTIMDQCLEWDDPSYGYNFSWYGFQIQLPDGGGGSGGILSSITSPLKDQGYIQSYNSTPGVNLVNLEIYMRYSQPTLLMNFNNDLFWDKYEFDFVKRDSTVSDDGNYQVYTKTFEGHVACTIERGPPVWTSSSPVVPALLISLTRLSSDDTEKQNEGSDGTELPNSAFAVKSMFGTNLVVGSLLLLF